MDKIQIVNLLLTRRCNLKCSYCSIVRNYKNIPDEYPKMSHYLKNEMGPDYLIEVLTRLKKHNPNVFVIMYGGEPLLYPWLSDIVNFCNKEDIYYTIITNNSDGIQPLMEDLILRTEYITGLSSSVDPLMIEEADEDRVAKSVAGFQKLAEYKDFIKDVVAEITIDNRNVYEIHALVSRLTEHGISSSITFIDTQKTDYYDFSNVRDESLLVERSDIVEEQFKKVLDDKLDVHMGEKLLPRILEILPSELDCRIERGIHNITIDADGSMRLCLRIRGTNSPKVTALRAIGTDGKINPFLKEMLVKDKVNYCRGCNWTCMIHSKLTYDNPSLLDDLVHSDKRD